MQFIGSFEINDKLMIKNPSMTDILAEMLVNKGVILASMDTDVLELPAQNGIWYAYHHYAGYNYPIGLLAVEKELLKEKSIAEINVNNLTLVGDISSGIGHSIAIVDKDMFDNTDYLYFSPSSTTYRVKDILSQLKSRGNDVYSKLLLKKLKPYIRSKYISKEKLTELYGTCSLPFNNIGSDIWSEDCMARISNNSMQAASIIGGVVSKSFSTLNTCYTDDNLLHRIVYIELDKEPRGYQPPFLACQ